MNTFERVFILGYVLLWIAIIALVSLVVFLTKNAYAQSPSQPPCAPRDVIEKRIHTEYGETPIGAGVVDGGTVYITNNPETGSFTILVRRPGGLTCLVMSGEGWASTDPEKPGKSL
jgi:hypothetical protein